LFDGPIARVMNQLNDTAQPPWSACASGRAVRRCIGCMPASGPSADLIVGLAQPGEGWPWCSPKRMRPVGRVRRLRVAAAAPPGSLPPPQPAQPWLPRCGWQQVHAWHGPARGSDPSGAVHGLNGRAQTWPTAQVLRGAAASLLRPVAGSSAGFNRFPDPATAPVPSRRRVPAASITCAIWWCLPAAWLRLAEQSPISQKTQPGALPRPHPSRTRALGVGGRLRFCSPPPVAVADRVCVQLVA